MNGIYNFENEVVFVAEYKKKVIGFIHAQIYDVLYYESMVNILGLAEDCFLVLLLDFYWRFIKLKVFSSELSGHGHVFLSSRFWASQNPVLSQNISFRSL